MQVDEPIPDVLQPDNRIVAAQVGVAGVEIDTDGGRIHEAHNAVEAGRRLAVLLMGLDPNQNTTVLGESRRLRQRVLHQHMVFLPRSPAGLGPLVCVHHGRTALGGEANRLLEVIAADVRAAQRRVRRQPRELHAGFLAGPPDTVRVLGHGDRHVVAGFAHQLPAQMNPGLNVFIAQFGRLFDAPFEGLVRVTDELHVHADSYLTHV